MGRRRIPSKDSAGLVKAFVDRAMLGDPVGACCDGITPAGRWI